VCVVRGAVMRYAVSCGLRLLFLVFFVLYRPVGVMAGLVRDEPRTPRSRVPI